MHPNAGGHYKEFVQEQPVRQMRQRSPGTIEYNPFLPDARDTISTYDPAHWLNESEEDALKERIVQILAHYPDKSKDKEPDNDKEKEAV